jgi:hypothetical protein
VQQLCRSEGSCAASWIPTARSAGDSRCESLFSEPPLSIAACNENQWHSTLHNNEVLSNATRYSTSRTSSMLVYLHHTPLGSHHVLRSRLLPGTVLILALVGGTPPRKSLVWVQTTKSRITKKASVPREVANRGSLMLVVCNFEIDIIIQDLIRQSISITVRIRKPFMSCSAFKMHRMHQDAHE